MVECWPAACRAAIGWEQAGEAKLSSEVGAGLGLILYYSRTFSPPPEPADPTAAGQQAYHNAVAGVWAAVFAFLGACMSRTVLPIFFEFSLTSDQSQCSDRRM